MKEIKFRAFDDLNKLMYNEVFINPNQFVFIEKGLNNTNDLSYELIGIYPMIKVMQYTGLKDKNGKEIYEGDIIKIANFNIDFKLGEPNFDWRVFEVQWNQTNYAFNNSLIYTPLSRYDRNTLEDYDIEIIGNIYENLELLVSNNK